MNDVFDIFVNQWKASLGDIDEEEPPKIQKIIKDEYLRDTSVLIILLVGTETLKNRKHVDWELYSSGIVETANQVFYYKIFLQQGQTTLEPVMVKMKKMNFI